MIRVDTTLIADALLTAPGWARVGITEPSEHLRRDAAEELARAVAASLADDDKTLDHSDQLALAL